MNHKKTLFVLLSASYLLDLFYWYGDVNNIEFITDLSILWFLTSLAGFIVSYYLLHKTDVKFKVALNIVITIGALINLVLIFLWYILKDFGF